MATGSLVGRSVEADVTHRVAQAEDVDGTEVSRTLEARFENLVGHTAGTVNVHSYGSTGTYLAAAAAVATAAGRELVIAHPIAISTAVGTISCPVRMVGAGKLVTATGGSVTLTGPFVSDLSHRFDTSAGGTITFSAQCPEVYPQWWGAKGDGVTDDTAAIAAAISSTRDVMLRAGNYLSGQQILATQGQTIRGEGLSSVLTQITAGANLLVPRAGYITIRNLRLDGVETAATNASYAIFTATATPATYLKIHEVTVSGPSSGQGFNSAIKFDDSCDHGEVVSCQIERLWGSAIPCGYGVLCGAVVGAQVLGNTILGQAGRGRHGVYFSAGCTDSTASGNYVSGLEWDAITQWSSAAQPACERNTITNNTVVNCADGSNPTSGSISIFGRSQKCVVANNTVTGSGQKGISVDGSDVTDCSDNIVIGNVVTMSGAQGIALTATVRTAVVGNVVHESSTNTAGAFANFALISYAGVNCVDTLLAANRATGSTYARAALGLDPGPAAPSGLVLAGNDFRPGASYTLDLAGVTGVQIDGRIQYRKNSVTYSSIGDGASITTGYVIPGAEQGDIVTVGHSSNCDGCILWGYVYSATNVMVVAANFSGSTKTISSGTLRIDIWKRAAPL